VLAFIKAFSTLQLSPALLKELRMALSSQKKKKIVVSAESISIVPRGGPKASQCPPSQHAGKRKANELASNSVEPANRRPAPSSGSTPLPAVLSVTGELAAIGSRQLGPPEGGVTYAAVLARPITPFQPSGSLKPTAMDSDVSEPAVSSKTTNRRMSSDMSGPLSDKPDGTTPNAQVASTCLPAGECPNKMPIFISGFSDTHAFLAWLWLSSPGSLTAQLKGEKLMVVPSTADRFRATVSALWSLNGKEGVSFYTFMLPEDHCV